MKKDLAAPHSIEIGAIVLALVTAFIHLYLAFQFPAGPDIIFLLNGLGYLAFVVLLYGPLPQFERYHHFIRWLLIGYTALTILLWVVIGAGSPLTGTPPNFIAYVDKLVEVALIVLLWRAR